VLRKVVHMRHGHADHMPTLRTCHFTSAIYFIAVLIDSRPLLTLSYSHHQHLARPTDNEIMANLTPDITAISNLLKRERYYRDTAQWDLCRATFHPNAAATYVNVAWLVALLLCVRICLGPQADRTRIGPLGTKAMWKTSCANRLKCTRARSTSSIPPLIRSTSTCAATVQSARPFASSPAPSHSVMLSTSWPRTCVSSPAYKSCRKLASGAFLVLSPVTCATALSPPSRDLVLARRSS
jgi:hypothetical protein